MALKAPGWCSGAIPTLRGWEDPNTNELLVSVRHSQTDIDAWHGIPSVAEIKKAAPKIEPVHMHEITPQPVAEAGVAVEVEEPAAEEDALQAGYTDLEEIDTDPEVTMDELQSMSKVELELLGREHGVELDRRKRKADMIAELKKIKKVGI